MKLKSSKYRFECVDFLIKMQEDGGSKIRVKNFTPFGRGIRSCPGAELSKLVAATFIHAAVTKYR